MTGSMELQLGDGSYESPIETDFLYLDDTGKYRVNRSGNIYNWTGPSISIPNKSNLILSGSEDGSTTWIDKNSLLITDYGFIG